MGHDGWVEDVVRCRVMVGEWRVGGGCGMLGDGEWRVAYDVW